MRPAGRPTLNPSATAPASTLLTEDIRDGQANCLDKVGDWLELASPQIRARSEVLLLSDNRPGAEGQTGHAVIRQGNGIFDPSTGKSYPSFEAFNADGRYSIAGTVNGPAMQRILSMPPGSPERQQAITRAGVSPALATMLVADSGTVNTSQAWTALTEGFRQSQTLSGAVTFALQQAANDPALQAELVALLQGVSADTLTSKLNAGHAYEIAGSGLAPGSQPPRPDGINSVGSQRVPGSALETAARQVPASLLMPALDAAVAQGRISAADRDVYASALGGTSTVSSTQISQALSDVQAAQKDYTTALEQRNALDQQLATDLASFGPYLTDTQRTNYIKEYRTLHATEYADINGKAAKLNDELTKNASILEQSVRGPDGTANAKAIADAYGALAQSPYADTALAWAAQASKPESPFAPFAATTNLDAIRQNAMSGSLAAYLEKNPQATADEAISHTQGVFTTAYLGQQAGGGGVDLAANLKGLPEDLKAGFAALRQLAHGDVEAGMNALKGLEAGSSKWGAAFAGAGVLIGIVQTGTALAKGDKLAAAWGAAFTGQQLSSALSTALGALKFSAAEKLATRAAGGLGAVAAALDILVQVDEINKGQGNAGTALSIAGDMAGLVGCALVAMGSTGVGVPIAAVGALVYVAGEALSYVLVERDKALKLREDQKSLLTKVGANPDQIMALAQDTTPAQVDALVKRTGWTRDQVVQLGATFPGFFSNTQYLTQLDQVGNAFGLTPTQRYELLNRIVNTGMPGTQGNDMLLQRFANAVSQFPNYPGIQIPQGLNTQQQYVYFLENLGAAMGSYDGMGLRNAASYLRPLAPR